MRKIVQLGALLCVTAMTTACTSYYGMGEGNKVWVAESVAGSGAVFYCLVGEGEKVGPKC